MHYQNEAERNRQMGQRQLCPRAVYKAAIKHMQADYQVMRD
jgi:hypothetical protein